MNDLDEYQRAAGAFANKELDDKLLQLASYGLGIAGEAGEVADLIKKHIGHGHALDIDKLTRELGDVLWYVARVAAVNGISLDEVASINIAKLQARYPNGFSVDASINRTA